MTTERTDQAETGPDAEARRDAASASPADASAEVAVVRTGPAVISGYLKTLTAAPGVYRMLDAEGTVIYVGKARSLKARVSNYARMGGHTNRIARMIQATATMEFVSVRTEAEALLLEANLIKRFRPRFNVLMRDDKSFPFILIRRDHKSPQILKHRGARSGKGDFFGPFASAGAVSRAINTLQRAFLLRSCSDSVFESRTRPCLLHQIKRCSAPCTGEIGEADYNVLVEEAEKFLRGESQAVRGELQTLMLEAADKLEFERAASYRNRLQALAHVTAEQTINSDGVEEADIFAAHQEGGQTCVQVFFFRSGQNWGNRAYFPKADRSLSTEEVLESFIAQFYDDKPVPRLILLSHDLAARPLLEEALSLKAERKVEIRVPQRGAKTDLVEHALANAREALGRRLAESSSQRRLLDGIAERFGLERPPRRIEVFDNSHIMGTNAVGAMIVAGPQGFAKAHYRKFNIKDKSAEPGDDYAMMREVLTRRFKRLATVGAEGEADEIRAPALGSPPHLNPPPEGGGDAQAATSQTSVGDEAAGQALGDGIKAGTSPLRGGDRGGGTIQSAEVASSPRPRPLPIEGRGEGAERGSHTLGAGDDHEEPRQVSDTTSPSPLGERVGVSGPADAQSDEGTERCQTPELGAGDHHQASEQVPDTGGARARDTSSPSPLGERVGVRGLAAAQPLDATAPVSRIMGPAPPPRGERGADAIAFGVLRADAPPQANIEPPLPEEEDEPDEVSPDTDDLPDRPDLVLIDGGAGQLAVAREVMAELGIEDIPLVGVAKGPDRDAGREHFHVPGRPHPFMLEPRDPVLYFVQRLRDEAHRFAIGTHRAKRAKALSANPLDEVAGIGPTRKRALLKHFGSAKAVARASVEDLTSVGGISAEMAQRIYDFFHERG